MAGIFKAYDIRGLYPSQLDEATAYRVGLAFPAVLDEADLAGGAPVIVGRDMRSHGEPLSRALIDGLLDAGLDVLDIGVTSTPMSYFAVGSRGAAGGVQVTASHNPAGYNGMKLSRREARPVSGDHGIPEIERRVVAGDLPKAARRGRVETLDVFEDYARHVLAVLRPERGRRLKVAVDAANGMATIYRPILERAGIELVPLFFELDGTFPNHEANPLKSENLRDLQAEIRRTGADLGVAFDGDADRAAFVDEKGTAIGSDLMTALVAGEVLLRHPGRAIVYDLRSSRAVAEYVREHGGQPIRERVGHSFIKATLRRLHGVFGGELAGHYYFEANYTADCALMAVFEVLNLLWESEQPLSELVRPLRRYAKSEETNFEVDDKQAKMDLLAERYADGEADTLDGITVQYPDWWFNVRPSNTEPFLRLVCEARDEAMLAARMGEIVALLGRPVH